jgi:hypothetical protein
MPVIAPLKIPRTPLLGSKPSAGEPQEFTLRSFFGANFGAIPVQFVWQVLRGDCRKPRRVSHGRPYSPHCWEANVVMGRATFKRSATLTTRECRAVPATFCGEQRLLPHWRELAYAQFSEWNIRNRFILAVAGGMHE